MKIAVIGAMQVEVDYLLSLMKDYKEITLANHKFYEGKLYNKDLIVAVSGIGKVATGALVATLYNNFKNINLLINVGISGGLKSRINATEVVVATKLSYADVDLSAFGSKYKFGQMANNPEWFELKDKYYKILSENPNLKFGTILTGDKFYYKENEVNKLLKQYFQNDNILCFDMESTAFAQACHFYEIDYIAIRAISDLIGSDTQAEELDSNLDEATENATKALIYLLERL